MPVSATAARTRSASCPMIAKISTGGTMCVAEAITCASSGLPPTSCSTLGNCDFSRVPLPAAMMAMATRGAELEALEEGSILDFFIRPTITRVPNVHEERIRVHMAISLLAEIESCGQAVPLECYARQNLLRLYRTSEQVRKDLELLVGL